MAAPLCAIVNELEGGMFCRTLCHNLACGKCVVFCDPLHSDSYFGEQKKSFRNENCMQVWILIHGFNYCGVLYLRWAVKHVDF